MSVRTLIELSISAGFGTSTEDTLFERDFSQLDDTLEHALSFTRTLPASGTPPDVEVPLDGITDIRLVYIEADGELQVKLFGTDGDALSLERPIDPTATSAGEKKAVFCAHISPASIHLVNPSATDDVNVKVCVVGDLVT
jgi:hypothetical protein